MKNERVPFRIAAKFYRGEGPQVAKFVDKGYPKMPCQPVAGKSSPGMHYGTHDYIRATETAVFQGSKGPGIERIHVPEPAERGVAPIPRGRDAQEFDPVIIPQ